MVCIDNRNTLNDSVSILLKSYLSIYYKLKK